MKHKKLIVFLSGITVIILVVLSIVSDAASDPNKFSIEEENNLNLGALQTSDLIGGDNVCEEYKPGNIWGSYGSDSGQFKTPYGLDVANVPIGDGSKYYYSVIYVADSENHRIQKITFTSLGPEYEYWGSYGVQNGNFNFPIGVAAYNTPLSTNPSEHFVYVLDHKNNRVQKFDSSGNFKLAWGGPGSGNGQFKLPMGITTDKDGYVYVTDTGNKRVQKFDSEGVFVTKWGTRSFINPLFNMPVGITSDAWGDIYVSDSGQDKIKKFTNTGGILWSWGQYGTSYSDLAVDLNGHIFVANTNGHNILKYDRDGELLATIGSYGMAHGELNSPRGVDISSSTNSGGIYVADTNNNRVHEFYRRCVKITIKKETPFSQIDNAFEFKTNFGPNFVLDVNESSSLVDDEISFFFSHSGDTYTFTEISEGYNLYNIKCDPPWYSEINLDTSTVSIHPSGSEGYSGMSVITCTFFNSLID